MSGMEVLGQNDRRMASGWGGVKWGWGSLWPQQGVLLLCAPSGGTAKLDVRHPVLAWVIQNGGWEK